MSEPRRDEERRLLVLAAIVALMACIPFVVARIPPSTDLAQHVAQMRLLRDAVGNHASPYAVQWFAPNGLAYAFVALGWLVASPFVAGRVALAAIVVAWIAATAFLARERERAAAGFVLASLFVFGHVLYWGFLEFLVGWPCFAAYIALVAPRSRPMTRTRWGLAIATAVLLYGAHVLWLGLAFVATILVTAADRESWRLGLRRVAPLVPMLAIAVIWSIRLRGDRASSGFDVAPHWFTAPWQRLVPDALVDAAFGGLRGPFEAVVFGLVVLYIVGGAFTARRTGGLDRGLAAASACFVAIALLAPDKYFNTIRFGARWMPVGLALAALAVPPPAWRPRVVRALAMVLCALFFAATTAAWMAFDEEEMNGFERALASVPDGSRVVGLDFVRESEIVTGQPFFQMFAYAQVVHGGELNFTFAEHGSSLVRYRVRRITHFTGGLEWFPARFSSRDLAAFDVAIVNAPPRVHDQLEQLPGMIPQAASGRWRLYRLAPASRR